MILDWIAVLAGFPDLLVSRSRMFQSLEQRLASSKCCILLITINIPSVIFKTPETPFPLRHCSRSDYNSHDARQAASSVIIYLRTSLNLVSQSQHSSLFSYLPSTPTRPRKNQLGQGVRDQARPRLVRGAGGAWPCPAPPLPRGWRLRRDQETWALPGGVPAGLGSRSASRAWCSLSTRCT